MTPVCLFGLDISCTRFDSEGGDINSGRRQSGYPFIVNSLLSFTHTLSLIISLSLRTSTQTSFSPQVNQPAEKNVNLSSKRALSPTKTDNKAFLLFTYIFLSACRLLKVPSGIVLIRLLEKFLQNKGLIHYKQNIHLTLSSDLQRLSAQTYTFHSPNPPYHLLIPQHQNMICMNRWIG